MRGVFLLVVTRARSAWLFAYEIVEKEREKLVNAETWRQSCRQADYCIRIGEPKNYFLVEDLLTHLVQRRVL
jgi:hypothetical protein